MVSVVFDRQPSKRMSRELRRVGRSGGFDDRKRRDRSRQPSGRGGCSRTVLRTLRRNCPARRGRSPGRTSAVGRDLFRLRGDCDRFRQRRTRPLQRLGVLLHHLQRLLQRLGVLLHHLQRLLQRLRSLLRSPHLLPRARNGPQRTRTPHCSAIALYCRSLGLQRPQPTSGEPGFPGTRRPRLESNSLN